MPPPATVEKPVVVKQRPKNKPVVPPTPVATHPAKTWDNDAITPYVVGKGDTLSGIAHRYDLTVSEIMSLNTISRPDKIMVGQKLVLPGKIDIKKPVKTVKSHSSKSIPAGASVYVVKQGDCLSVIAHRAGVSTKALREANGLKNDVIYVGKKLVIPGGKKVKPESGVRHTSSGHKPPKISPVHKPQAAPVKQNDVKSDAGEEFPLPDLAPEPAAAAPSTGNVQYYIVKPDDNILSVVSEFNISISDLRKANNLTSDILKPGQKLVIPTAE
jgi:LysM repeat protein